MLVCLARQELIEQRPQWARETHDSSLLELGPLSHGDTRALIRQLLPAGAASDEVREQLTTRAEGNPLFLQQMIAFLRETGDSVDVSVPPTIHALLAARLDRLTAAERRAIGAASVIGREFWAEAVAAVADDAETTQRARDAHAQAARRARAVDASRARRATPSATSSCATRPTSRSPRRTAPSCTSASRTGSSSAIPSA